MRDLSLEMVKLYKDKKYTIWNTVNVIYNTNPDDPAKYQKVMLLAEMMVRNHLKTLGVQTREGRCCQWLLMEILIREKKFEEVEKELEDRMQNYVVSQRLLDERITQRGILRELGREKEIVGLLEEDILKGDKSDWDALLYYIDVVVECIFLNFSFIHSLIHSFIVCEDPCARLESFKEKYCQECTTREKWLFQLEVASRFKKDELVTLIKGYISYIGHKPCCFVDLERWLPAIKEKAGIHSHY